jgi:hypothetical protein
MTFPYFEDIFFADIPGSSAFTDNPAKDNILHRFHYNFMEKLFFVQLLLLC